MRKAFIAMVLILLSTWMATAQSLEDRLFRIGASLDYSFTGYREETYSLVNRYLNALTFILDGNIKRGDFLHSFNIGFFMGNAEMAGGERVVLQKDFCTQARRGISIPKTA